MSDTSENPRLSGWGRIFQPGREVLSENLRELTGDAVLARGLGRAYGDSALPPPGILDVATTVLADRILDFDPQSGRIRCEAGVSLYTLNNLLLPRGFFTPVTPGTQYVTVGGMVAADVHGKNHHVEGTFGKHVESLLLRVADGRLVECSPTLHEDLFWATVGGMGLTGHIIEVVFRLRHVPSPWIFEERLRFERLDPLVAALKASAESWPFTVGWIDCVSRGRRLGRGVLVRGRWATPSEAPDEAPRPKARMSVPVDFPNWVLNKWSIRLFNELIYRMHRPFQSGVQHPEEFFYPLDKILHWNRAYGKRGFTQYQCVVPEGEHDDALKATRHFLEVLTDGGGADGFLCVIKDCAEQGQGMLSFPKPGISLAIDLAVGPDIQRLVDRLNEAVIGAGGRIYLAKDAFTRADHFRSMEPRLDGWLAVRRQWDPASKIRSSQSVRVLGDPQ